MTPAGAFDPDGFLPPIKPPVESETRDFTTDEWTVLLDVLRRHGLTPVSDIDLAMWDLELDEPGPLLSDRIAAALIVGGIALVVVVLVRIVVGLIF